MNSIIGLALFMLVNSVASTNYCKENLCKKGKHVACGFKGQWGHRSECGDKPRLHNLTPEDKQFILDLHNKNRHEIASGALLPKYEPAANMKEVVWNDELAYVASANAKTCVFAHDECRNTDSHPYSGQNLAIVGQSKGFKDFREAYADLHNKWFIEHEHCGMSNINKYSNKPTNPGKQIGHFTQMVSDQVDQVGCAISMYERDNMKYVYIVCNYSYISMRDRPIYVAGKPKCKKFSHRYKSLCVN